MPGSSGGRWESQGGTTKGTKRAKVEEGDGGAIVGLTSPIAPMFGAPHFVRFVVPRIPFQIVGINPGR